MESIILRLNLFWRVSLMNSETAKIKAKSKVMLWCTLLVCFVLVGGAWEYLHQTQPLDQTTLIFKPEHENGKTVEQVVNKKSVEQAKENKVENVPAKDETVVVDSTAEPEEPEAEFEALQEFLGYMQELQKQIDGDWQHVSVLDKIEQEEIAPKEEKPQQVVVFDENKIEVYDSEKGVVGVIDVTTQTKDIVEPVAEIKTEPQVKEEVSAVEQAIVANGTEVIENAEQEIIDAAEKAQMAATAVENIVRENVQAEMNRVEESGDEMPIILIPGLQNM